MLESRNYTIGETIAWSIGIQGQGRFALSQGLAGKVVEL
jgi:hypothetical protein